jgi:thiaminase/transcriptional activator TenA
MSERFSEQLRTRLDAVWEAQHQHPFVRGLGDGSLDPGRFQVWLRQDFLFLIEYARLFALAAARAGELEAMKWAIAMAYGVIHSEMLLHEAYAIESGLTRSELESSVKLPTTRAYTDHLLRIASMGAYSEVVAALLPCLWGHAEIGQRLRGQAASSNTPYARWVNFYSGPLAANLARQGRDLLDGIACTVGPPARARAEDAFAVSSRYEWMFWEMCWQGESWPV